MRPEIHEHNGQSKTEEVIQHIKEYINTNVELIKLQAIDKAAGGIGVLSLVLMLIFLFVCMFILISIGLAVLISEAIGNWSSGFFIVAGIYLLLGVVLFLSRDAIAKKVIASKLISSMLPENSI